MSLARAQQLLAEGRLGEAQEALRVGDSARYDPRRDIMSAEIAAARGDNERAVQILRQAIERMPQHAPLHLYLGIHQLDLSLPAAAMLAFEEVLRLQPSNDLAASYRGMCMLELGREEDAGLEFAQRGYSDNRAFLVRLTLWVEREWIEKGRFFHPTSAAREVVPVEGRPSMRRAQKHFFAHRYAQCLAELEHMVRKQQQPDDDLLFACALSSEMLLDHETALSYLTRVVAKPPPDAISAARARNLIRLRRLEEGARELAHVLMIGPEDYAANYYLGVLCLAYQQPARARALFARAYGDYVVDTLEYQFWQIKQAIAAPVSS